MIKQLWQRFFPPKTKTVPVQNTDRPNQTNLTDQSDRLLRLESEIQTLRLTLNEKEQLISKLRTESDRQRQNETRNQAIAYSEDHNLVKQSPRNYADTNRTRY